MSWISVKDELPEPEIKVLFCTSEKIHIGCYFSNYKNWESSWCTCGAYDDFRYGVVTHWMPLPNLPKND